MKSRHFTWAPETKHKMATKVVLFLISPFLGVISALNSLNTKSSHKIIFWFCVSFGIAFTVTNVRTEGSIDGISYRLEFEESQDITYDTYQSDFDEYLKFDDGHQDFYSASLAFGVSRFSSNYHVFFLFAALIFAFFQLRTLRFFTSNDNFSM